jgi:FADH2 O2-dependent halogenase
VHHVFDGGWVWVLRFDHGVTSAGFAATDALLAELGEGEAAWHALLRRFPSIGEQFAATRPVQPFTHRRPLTYRCGRIAGEGWALLPSAAAFVDPYFSNGFVLTLAGIQRLGAVLEGTASLEAYAADTLREADAVADLASACYATFADFPAHRALALLYFAAASHAEMARRLGRPAALLLQDRPPFREALRRACAAARRGAPLALHEVRAAIEPFDVAGLCDPTRRDHFPVDPRDAIAAAHKLGATPAEVEAWFSTIGP